MSADQTAPRRRAWYQVAEVWLILILLGATVIGSLGLVYVAVHSPDRHLVVPYPTPRSSKIPPVVPQNAVPQNAVPQNEAARAPRS